MLTYKRKEGSVTQGLFNNRFIRPMMGKPDTIGNYIAYVTDTGEVRRIKSNDDVPKGTIAFMAHHDTVHRTDGIQKVYYDPTSDFAFVDDECLGADCTTGVWLILEMIKAKVPGLYVIHTGEECGGIGSGALVKSKPTWLNNVDYAISFDRYGTTSIITHQMGMRTCSESFTTDLASILNMNFIPDSGGVYTDSYEYADIVSECTNISVGYYKQHTKNETQDIAFAIELRDALIKADWSKLRAYRDPTVIDYDDFGYVGKGWTSKNKLANGYWDNYSTTGSSYVSRFDTPSHTTDDDNLDVLMAKYSTMERVVEAFPYEIAEILSEYGYNKEGLLKDLLHFHRSSIPF